MEKISVIITCFNREEYISLSIESVLSSDFNEFELIIVDDCSTDKSWEIIKKYSEIDDRIIAHRNNVNLGDYKNRNFAVTLCSTELIKFVDSDDEIYHYSLKVFYDSFLKYPNAGMYVSSKYPEFLNKKFPILLTPKESFELHFLKYGILDVGPLSVMFKKDNLLAVGSFSGTRFVGDTEVFLKMAARFSIVLVNGSLVYWRQHTGQEIKNEALVFDREVLSLRIYKDVLFSELSPLENSISNSIIRNKKKELLISILKKTVKLKKYTTGLKILLKVLNE